MKIAGTRLRMPVISSKKYFGACFLVRIVALDQTRHLHPSLAIWANLVQFSLHRKALRIRYINGMEVRKKRPKGFKKMPRGVK